MRKTSIYEVIKHNSVSMQTERLLGEKLPNVMKMFKRTLPYPGQGDVSDTGRLFWEVLHILQSKK